MKTYQWKLNKFEGEVESKDIKEAFHAVIDKYFSFPYTATTSVRLTIEIKEK